MIDYAHILTKNYVGKEWSLNGDSYEGLTWLSDSPKPTQAELDAQWEAIQESITANAYKSKRAAEYPNVTEYLDGLVKGDQAQIQAYIDACLAVKARHPKGVK